MGKWKRKQPEGVLGSHGMTGAAKRPPYRDCALEGGGCRLGAARGSWNDPAYMTELITRTWDMIRAGAVDMAAARIGYDAATGATIWSYRSLVEQLMAAGHCEDCAENFVQSLAAVLGDDGNRENIMAVTVAEQAVETASLRHEGGRG